MYEQFKSLADHCAGISPLLNASKAYFTFKFEHTMHAFGFLKFSVEAYCWHTIDTHFPLSAGQDFVEVDDSSHYFPAGSVTGSVICINITITDNRAFEKDEYFTVVVSSKPNVEIHGDVTIFVQDDDCKTILCPPFSSFPSHLYQSTLSSTLSSFLPMFASLYTYLSPS